MAFTVEDGTGLAGANSYCSVAFADAYFTERGITAWTGSSTVKEQALVRATDYLENRFTFKGTSFSEDQALHFPIEDDEDSDLAAELPVNLLKATSEYALRALSAALAPDLTVDATGLTVVSKTEKVGPLEESVQYQQGGSVSLIRAYPAADMLLRGLTFSGQRVIRG